jgi:hypothetical protein
MEIASGPSDPDPSFQSMLTTTQTYLTEMVRRLVADPSTSTAIRNECHRLLIAIERNHHRLMEESLEHLTFLTDEANSRSHDQAIGH